MQTVETWRTKRGAAFSGTVCSSAIALNAHEILWAQLSHLCADQLYVLRNCHASLTPRCQPSHFVHSVKTLLKGMKSLAEVAWRRVVAAYHTVPPSVDPIAWAFIGTFAALVMPIGVYSGILNLKIEKRPLKWLEVLFVVFLSRGLLEELVFRVMALPHPAVDGPTPPAEFALRAVVSTAVFVGAHLLIPGERARKTFRDPGFLTMCAVFGAMCSAVYYLTASLYVIWLVHGVPVAIWLLLLGGAEKVQ